MSTTESAVLRILVIDDDAYDRLAVRRCLQQSSVAASVHEAGTEEEALSRLEGGGYDCVLLDYYIPGSDGIALFHRIRAAAGAVPIIMFTGRGDEDIAVELMKAGAVDYLPKGSMTPERLAAGLRHAIELARNSAARRDAERELAETLELERTARADAERAMRLRDEVLSVVAHDLRNPLHTATTTVSLMRELAQNDPQQQRHLGFIERSMHEMDRLIGDLLDLARIEAGTFAVRKEPVDVRSLLAEAVTMFEPRATEREITLDCTAEGTLQACGDRTRILQVMSNLLGNAFKFTPPGGRVVVRAAERDGCVEVSVEDTGQGIADDHLAHVFDRFWRADGTSRGGAGLGLAICRGIISDHGGRIWVESELGRGSAFRFTLPMLHADAASTAAPAM